MKRILIRTFFVALFLTTYFAMQAAAVRPLGPVGYDEHSDSEAWSSDDEQPSAREQHPYIQLLCSNGSQSTETILPLTKKEAAYFDRFKGIILDPTNPDEKNSFKLEPILGFDCPEQLIQTLITFAKNSEDGLTNPLDDATLSFLVDRNLFILAITARDLYLRQPLLNQLLEVVKPLYHKKTVMEDFFTKTYTKIAVEALTTLPSSEEIPPTNFGTFSSFLSPSKKYCAKLRLQQNLQLYKTDTHELLLTINHTNPIKGIVFDPSEKYIALIHAAKKMANLSTSQERYIEKIRIINIGSKESFYHETFPYDAYSRPESSPILFSPDGNYVVICNKNNYAVHFMPLVTRKISLDDGEIASIAFSDCKRFVARRGEQQTVVILQSLETGDKNSVIFIPNKHLSERKIKKFCFSHDGNTLAVHSNVKSDTHGNVQEVTLFSTTTGTKIDNIRYNIPNSRIYEINFTPDDEALIIRGEKYRGETNFSHTVGIPPHKSPLQKYLAQALEKIKPEKIDPRLIPLIGTLSQELQEKEYIKKLLTPAVADAGSCVVS